MKAVQITDTIWWVGAIDWNIRDFHGYATNRGTTYNAFLLMAEKPTLIDTVKAPFVDEMMARIESVIDPSKIEVVVSNHAEMDHSGALPEVIARVQPAKVYASKMGVKALKAHFHWDVDVEAVSDGQTIDLGGRSITFYETRMLHWPDSMMAVIPEENVLISQDGFGMHLASEERFDDELSWEVMEYELRKYYANILTPYSNFIEKLYGRVQELGLNPTLVLPDHGPIWRKYFGDVLNCYAAWAEQLPTKKAVVVYDTMWGSTQKMATAIADGIQSVGATAKVLPLGSAHRSDVATELIDAGAIVVGTPTLNNQVFPTIADLLTYIKGLRFKNLKGAAFGSFGWGGEGAKHVHQALVEMDIDVVAEPLAVKYVPDHDQLNQCAAFGEIVGRSLLGDG